MKKILMILFMTVFISSFAVATSENFLEVQEGAFSSFENLTVDQISEINTILEDLYKKYDVIIKFQFPADVPEGDDEYFWNEYVHSEFYRQEMDEKATPMLNLLFVIRFDKNGELNLNVGFSKTCGWDLERLSAAINKNDRGYIDNYYDYVLGMVETMKNELRVGSSFALVCDSGLEEIDNCKNLFSEDRGQGEYKDVLIVPTDYSEDETEVKKMIKEVILGLKENPIWNDNFKKIRFIYYDEMQSIGNECDSYSDFRCLSEVAWQIQSICAADQYIVMSNDKFRSYAFSGQGAYMSIPYSKKNFDFKEDFYNYFQSHSKSLNHELGHSLFCLSDEYIEMTDGSYDESRDEPEYPNCASSIDEAKDWWGRYEGSFNVGYYDGCAYIPGNIRPHDKSAMSDPRLMEYGLVNDMHINNIFAGVREC